jgi:serine/threonine protein kinase
VVQSKHHFERSFTDFYRVRSTSFISRIAGILRFQFSLRFHTLHTTKRAVPVSFATMGLEEYTVGKAAGRGKFSTVYRAKRLRDNQTVALKKIDVGKKRHRIGSSDNHLFIQSHFCLFCFFLVFLSFAKMS